MIEERVRTHESFFVNILGVLQLVGKILATAVLGNLADGADGSTVLFVDFLIMLACYRVDECG